LQQVTAARIVLDLESVELMVARAMDIVVIYMTMGGKV
jgi:hypothetical protein